MKRSWLALIAPAAVFVSAWMQASAADKVLILTRTVVTATSGYREDNIAPTRLALKNFLQTKGLTVDTSENDKLFNPATLAGYKTIIFLKTSGDILNDSEQTAFENWFKAGGGFVGIHSALDTEYGWPFYGQLLGGGWYKNLGATATDSEVIVVEDSADISTQGLPHRWHRVDEVYNLRANPRAVPTVHVLLTVDESTLKAGTPGADHPMSWRNELMGGRAWITAMGHTTASYSDPLFLNHLWGGVQYALGRATTGVAAPEARLLRPGEGKSRLEFRDGVMLFFPAAVGVASRSEGGAGPSWNGRAPALDLRGRLSTAATAAGSRDRGMRGANQSVCKDCIAPR